MTLGVLLVGLGGNNGSTFYTSLLAHRDKISWKDHSGKVCYPDWLGSTIMCGSTDEGKTFFERYLFTNPEDIVVHGWDISKANMSEAVKRAGVLNWQIEEKLREKLSKVVPMKAVYDPQYIALNQMTRADNVYHPSTPLSEIVYLLQVDIRDFKQSNNLDHVIVLWTANTEKMMEVNPDYHDSAAGILKAINEDRRDLISPSMLYAVASMSEGCTYLNGSPQNTFVSGILEMAADSGAYVGGSDFKTGQTRFKSMMMDFLSTCGIKVTSIASYNHLGNNDGLNLSQEDCFRSKELSKRDVVADVVENNPKLYPEGKGPDHCVVIKYIPNVGDSKRAIDEYVSDIFMGGKQTISVYNVCEDSLLATPVMLDLVLVTDYFLRKCRPFSHPVLSELSLFFKAPLPDKEGRVINVFRRQHQILERGLEECQSSSQVGKKLPFGLVLIDDKLFRDGKEVSAIGTSYHKVVEEDRLKMAADFERSAKKLGNL